MAQTKTTFATIQKIWKWIGFIYDLGTDVQTKYQKHFVSDSKKTEQENAQQVVKEKKIKVEEVKEVLNSDEHREDGK